MKIAILLPYKENFSPEYPGAVSLFVNETSKNSKFKKKIIVFGNTNFKKKYNLKYININLLKSPLWSQTKNYVNKFSNLLKKYNFSIIEVHNRPSYIHNYIINILIKYIPYIFIMTLYQWMDQKQLRKKKFIKILL